MDLPAHACGTPPIYLSLSLLLSVLLSQTLALYRNHFLCRPRTLCFTQPNFKQIWQERAGLCNRRVGGGHRSPCLPLTTENIKLVVLMGKNVIWHYRINCKNKSSVSLKSCVPVVQRQCVYSLFCPTGNNLGDLISPQHLSQPRDLPGRLSALSNLLVQSFFKWQ